MIYWQSGKNLSYNKYKNKKVNYDGFLFDSILECDRYKELQLLLKAREIKNLTLQPKFVVQEKFSLRDKNYREIIYKADFLYDEKTSAGFQSVCEDSKWKQTRDFKIKMKMFLKGFGDKMIFRISTRSGRSFKLVDY